MKQKPTERASGVPGGVLLESIPIALRHST